MALANIFGDIENTKGMLEADGAINFVTLLNTETQEIHENDCDVIKFKEKKHFKLSDRMSELVNNAEYNEPTNLNRDNDNEKDSQSLKLSTNGGVTFQYDRIVSSDKTGALFEFIPTKKIKGMEDFVLESDHYNYYKDSTSDFPLNYVKEESIDIPKNLLIYTYEEGNVATYKAPRRDLTGVFSHYLLDGASILPPLMLDLKPGHIVLDACAAPGGKSLLLLQTLYSNVLICNDIQESRINRLKRVMNDYLYDFEEKWNGQRVILKQSNIIDSTEYDTYDRILVDVPCTTDRHVLNSNENNLFKPTRTKERLKLPETQAAILANCLRLLKPGGTLVYSTCSLSPVQNDGVVHMALSTVFKENGISVTIQYVYTYIYKEKSRLLTAAHDSFITHCLDIFNSNAS